MSFIKKLTKQREFLIFMLVAAIFLIMGLITPVFWNYANISALFLSLSTEVLIAVGMTILMVSGGFDMSVGSVLAFSGVTACLALKAGAPVPLVVLLGIAIGAAAGLFNGFIIAKVGINAFVTTLASLSLFRGLTLIVTRGQNIAMLGDVFNNIGQSVWLGVQAPIWYMVIIVIIGDVLLRRSRFFRQNYYIGSNEKAAILSGIQVDKMKILNYVLVGILAGLSGIVLSARMGAATVTQGTGLELRVITAVIIGGASLAGGEGTILGAFLGSMLMALITNALTLLGVDVYWQTFVTGATLLGAVLIDQLGKRRKLIYKEKIPKGGVVNERSCKAS
jgi:ribose transport system permease protein